MSRGALQDLIVVTLAEAEGGMTASDIHESLTHQYEVDVSERTVKTALKELAENDELIREKVPDGTPGRPPFHYYHPDIVGEGAEAEEGSGVPDETVLESEGDVQPKNIASRGDIQAENVEELPDGIVYDIVEQHLETAQLTQDLKEMAPVLADENPNDLLVQMVEWTIEQINRLGKKLYELLEKGHSSEVRVERDRYQDFAGWARRYWHRFWSLTAYNDPGPNMLCIPDHDEFVKADSEDELPKAKFDEELVRQRIESRAFGDEVLTTFEIDDDVTSAVGTDASIADVSFPSEQVLAPETDVQLFAGAAALQHENRRFTDFDFSPRDLRQYQHRRAFRRGLLLSKRVLPQLSDSQIEHAKWAAMDLRQYKESCRIIDEEIEWRPYGDTEPGLSDWSGPDVMFSDGRILPLVHQRSDFSSSTLYGELVRREIRWFSKFSDYASDDDWNTDAIFAGVVKRPAFSWFAPIVFWYLETQYRADEGEMVELPRNVYQPPISDVMIPHVLFVGLVEENGPPDEGEMFTTFRVLRRYYDMSIAEEDLPPVDDGGEVINVDSPEEWMSYFERLQERAEDYGYETIDIEKYRNFGFANLCANVGTLMCYAAPRNIYQNRIEIGVRLPRIEILVNPPGDAPGKMNTALSWFGHHPVADDEHKAEGFSTLDEVPVVVPAVIVESDRAAKYARDYINDDVGQDIRDLIRALR